MTDYTLFGLQLDARQLKVSNFAHHVLLPGASTDRTMLSFKINKVEGGRILSLSWVVRHLLGSGHNLYVGFEDVDSPWRMLHTVK